MSGVTDPIADMLARVRNAMSAGHDNVLVPPSNMKVSIARIFKDEGFIRDFDIVRSQPRRMLRIRLGYTGRKEAVIRGMKRVSKPGLRVYTGKDAIPQVYSGMGTSVMSTPQGVMTGREARRRGIGGEVVCYVW